MALLTLKIVLFYCWSEFCCLYGETLELPALFSFGYLLHVHVQKAQLHGSQFWRQFFLKSASRFQYSNLIGCVHANYDVIVNILGVRYLENRRTRFRATAPLASTKPLTFALMSCPLQ